ncbi:hypothetical protein ABH905_002076 [Pseudomonas frederiksbergensis]|uniref:bacteriocin immunity protein n=1 Tax=Pseudomonas frederiksbergensis TaxID=104087 RepID=UPI003D1F3B5C
MTQDNEDSIIDFTKDEFIGFMNEILVANKASTGDVLVVLFDRFCEITGHPDGTDLIYYPDDGSNGSPGEVARGVVKGEACSSRLDGTQGLLTKAGICQNLAWFEQTD